MKVSLITPPYHGGFPQVFGNWPNLGILHVAGALKKAGHEVCYLDSMAFELSHEDIMKHIETFKPGVVGTFAWTASIFSALKVLQIAKDIDPNIITLIGGIHPHFCFQECLKNPSVDFVVRGEGEATTPELLEVIKKRGDLNEVRGIAFQKDGKVFITQPRPLVDLNCLEPAWDIVDFSKYHQIIKKLKLGGEGTFSVYLDFSRGCPHNCHFCSQQKFWQRGWRSKTPARFVEEVEMLASKYKVGTIVLSDELPTADRQVWEEVLDRLIMLGSPTKLAFQTRSDNIVRDQDILYKYKQAGTVDIYVGIESSNEKQRNRLGKQISDDINRKAINLLRDHGIVSETSFLIGLPDETPESIKETLDRAKNYYNPDLMAFLFISPWPYTEFYEQAKSSITVTDYSQYNMMVPIIKPDVMSIEELQTLVKECYISFYRDKLTQWYKMEDGPVKDYLISQVSSFANEPGFSFVDEIFEQGQS